MSDPPRRGIRMKGSVRMSKPNRLSWLPFLAEPVPEDLTEPA